MFCHEILDDVTLCTRHYIFMTDQCHVSMLSPFSFHQPHPFLRNHGQDRCITVSSHQCTEPDDSPPTLENYINPNSVSNASMTQRGNPQYSPKWEPDGPQIMDKGDLLGVLQSDLWVFPLMNCLSPLEWARDSSSESSASRPLSTSESAPPRPFPPHFSDGRQNWIRAWYPGPWGPRILGAPGCRGK